MGYSFPGVPRFAEKTVADPARRSEVANDDKVRKAGEQIGTLSSLEPGQQSARQESMKVIEDQVKYHEDCIATIEAMRDDAARALGMAPKVGLAAEPGRTAISHPAPSALDDDADPFAHEQPTGPDGKPLTLDPKNPDHQQYLDRVPRYGDFDPGHFARKMAARAETERQRRAALLQQPRYNEGLIIGPSRPPESRGPTAIEPGDVDLDYDRWARSPEGRAELEAGRANQEREAYYARVGADVGMSGGPPRPDTGVNQDINQVDAPTQFDKPDQALDPFQGKNPPYTEPNETGFGTQGVKRPQTATTGSGITPASIAAQARVEHAQEEPPIAGAVPDVRPHVPSEAGHPEFGGKGKAGKGK